MRSEPAPISDSHRFGKQVVRVNQANSEDKLYLKPRSIRLEAFFLDETIRPFWVNEILGIDESTSKTLHFQSDINNGLTWSGSIQEVESLGTTLEDLKQYSTLYSYQYGRLLAFCTHFGLIDLHAENIVIRKISIDGQAKLYPIPVDIEVALWNCVSGMDTLLYPSRLISWKYCGFVGQFYKELYKEQEEINTPPESWAIKDILRGVLDGTAACIKHLDLAVRDLDKLLIGEPIRVLLRSTHIYRRLLLGADPKTLEAGPLLPEEILQLDANDIPYFFTYREHSDRNQIKKLFYFSSENEVKSCEPKQFQKTLDSATVPSHLFLDQTRIFQLTKLSILQILKLTHPQIANSDFSVQSQLGELQVNSATDSVTIHHKMFSAAVKT